MMYAKLEEDHGLMKNAMAIYDRAAKTIDINDRCLEPRPNKTLFTVHWTKAQGARPRAPNRIRIFLFKTIYPEL